MISLSRNGRRNALLNNYIIDKFVVTKNGFVCIRILGGHSFYGMVPQFSTVNFVFIQRGTCIKRLFCPPYGVKKIKVALHKFLLISLLEK